MQCSVGVNHDKIYMICKYEFSCKKNLYAHLKKVHKVDPQLEQVEILEQKLFKCLKCEKEYRFKKNLKDHMRKIHKVEPIQKDIIECKFCEKKFNFQCRFQQHQNNHPMTDHNYSLKNKSRLICPQEICGEYFPSFIVMRTHLSEVHNISTQFECLTFRSDEEFKLWKKTYERENVSFYFLGQNYVLASGETRKIYYCHRSFSFKSTNTGIRSLKNIGTNKIGKACPSLIDVTVSPNIIKVKIWSTHVGHSCDIGRTYLYNETKAEIAGKLHLGVSFKRIIRDIRDSAENSDSRDGLVTIQDLKNFCYLGVDSMEGLESSSSISIAPPRKEDTECVNFI